MPLIKTYPQAIAATIGVMILAVALMNEWSAPTVKGTVTQTVLPSNCQTVEKVYVENGQRIKNMMYTTVNGKKMIALYDDDGEIIRSQLRKD